MATRQKTTEAHRLLRECTEGYGRVNALARRAGVSRQSVHDWLNGAMPGPRRWQKIEDATDGHVPCDAWLDFGDSI